jgi:cytochrome c oxidase assembly protein subunit 15
MANKEGWMNMRHFTKLVAWMTLLLIFVGGMVTSTDSGLSVPDWPLSFGTLFPPMAGGVFFEHGHRVVAALDGLLILALTIIVEMYEKRRWVRTLAIVALGLVVVQGIMGGMTVLFKLPVWLSAAHAVMAQTLLVVCIALAYSQSMERSRRVDAPEKSSPGFVKVIMVLMALVYVQLIIAAVMRHTDSGLAIPDFPTMGGAFLPTFDHAMLDKINAWRLEHGLSAVTMAQVVVHFMHRLGAFFILIGIMALNMMVFRGNNIDVRVKKTVLWLDVLLLMQISLGIVTVLSMEQPVLASVHVAGGAGVLGLSALLFLRAMPVSWAGFVSKKG